MGGFSGVAPSVEKNVIIDLYLKNRMPQHNGKSVIRERTINRIPNPDLRRRRLFQSGNIYRPWRQPTVRFNLHNVKLLLKILEPYILRGVLRQFRGLSRLLSTVEVHLPCPIIDKDTASIPAQGEHIYILWVERDRFRINMREPPIKPIKLRS